MLFPSDSLALVELLDALNKEQRLILLDRYCSSCGSIKVEKSDGSQECSKCMDELSACPV